jgi:hypothetical protein
MFETWLNEWQAKINAGRLIEATAQNTYESVIDRAMRVCDKYETLALYNEGRL